MWNYLNLLMLVGCWLTVLFGVRRFEQMSRILLSIHEEGLASSLRSDLIFFYQIWGIRILAIVVFIAWICTFQYHNVTTQVQCIILAKGAFTLV